jgi:hypothetical protein
VPNSKRKTPITNVRDTQQAVIQARLNATTCLWDGPVPERVVEHLRTFPVPPPAPPAFVDIRIIYPEGVTPLPLSLELARKDSAGEPISQTAFVTKVPRAMPTEEHELFEKLEDVWAELGEYDTVRRLLQKAFEEGKVEIVQKSRRCWVHVKQFKRWVRDLVRLGNRVREQKDIDERNCRAFDREVKAREAAERAAKRKHS